MDESPFLAAIIEQPHDWGPRLVFADWLEERGDPRSELIRLLFELTRAKCVYRNRKESRLRSLMSRGVVPVTPIVINSIGMEFVAVPPGHFLMGSPPDEPGRDDDETQHPVTLTRGFFLGRFPVTQEQWRAILGENPCFFRGENLPAESVTRIKALEFIRELSRREGRSYRLPTEAEWEYACRAGTSTPYYVGSRGDPALMNLNASTRQRRPHGIRYRERTTAVGSFPPNAWGLCDMHGNVLGMVRRRLPTVQARCESQSASAQPTGQFRFAWRVVVERARTIPKCGPPSPVAGVNRQRGRAASLLRFQELTCELTSTA